MSFQLDRGLFQYDFSDQHAILGVSVNAEEYDIRDRYKVIARLLHPDSSQWKTERDQQLAVQLFSRLVTHAYGKLSRSSQREEQTIMLQLLGKRLSEDSSKITFAEPLSQQLYQSGADFEQVYDRFLIELAAQQYSKVSDSIQIVNQISELNMVYLLRKQLQSVTSAPPTAPNNSVKNNTKEAATGDVKVSPIEGALRRAEGYMAMKDWGKAVLELRDATKVEPTSARAHALLGLGYLRQQQTTMAKISINKAIQLNPKDPQVIQAKQEFDRASSSNSSSAKAPAKKAGEGMFGNFFGKK